MFKYLTLFIAKCILAGSFRCSLTNLVNQHIFNRILLTMELVWNLIAIFSVIVGCWRGFILQIRDLNTLIFILLNALFFYFHNWKHLFLYYIYSILINVFSIMIP